MALLFVGFADESVAFLPFGSLEPIRRDLDLSYSEGGFLLALYPGIGVLATPLGFVADHASRRLLAALGGVGYGTGLLLFAVAGHFWVLVAAVCLMGFAGDALVRGAEVALVDAVGDRVEPAVSRMTLLGAVGDLVGPLLLAAALASGVGWRGAFVVSGVAMVLYGLWLGRLPLPPPHPQPYGHTPWRAFLDVARDRRVLRAGVLGIVIDVFDEPFIGFAIAYLITVRGFGPATATLAAGAGIVGGIVASAWASRTNRHVFGLRAPALLLAAGAVAVLASPHPAVAAAGTTATVAAVYLAWIVLQARFLTLRPGQAGTTTAVVSGVSQIAIVFPLAVGFIADRRGLAAAMGLYVAAAVVFVILTRGDVAAPRDGARDRPSDAVGT